MAQPCSVEACQLHPMSDADVKELALGIHGVHVAFDAYVSFESLTVRALFSGSKATCPPCILLPEGLDVNYVNHSMDGTHPRVSDTSESAPPGG